jgi:alkanesulfonate monooxygenase
MTLTAKTARPYGAPRKSLAAPGTSVFTINPRSRSESAYWQDIQKNIDYSQQHGATGVLCFSGNDTQIDPWIVASQVAARSVPRAERLRPLVALNPNTMPPFSAAKLIASIEQVHGVTVALNLITGVSSRDREVLGDTLSHDDRYDRLEEYMTIVNGLLTRPEPISFEGRFYRIHEAQLLPRSRPRVAPQYFVSGHSEPALRLAKKFDAILLGMLSSGLSQDLVGDLSRKGLYFGIVTRPAEAEAWRVARTIYPETREGQAAFETTMALTDSQWKQQLHARAGSEPEICGHHWLGPFRNFQADCPFLVGSHEQVSGILSNFMRMGIRRFIIDLTPDREEFENIAEAFALAYAELVV